MGLEGASSRPSANLARPGDSSPRTAEIGAHLAARDRHGALQHECDCRRRRRERGEGADGRGRGGRHRVQPQLELGDHAWAC